MTFATCYPSVVKILSWVVGIQIRKACGSSLWCSGYTVHFLIRNREELSLWWYQNSLTWVQMINLPTHLLSLLVVLVWIASITINLYYEIYAWTWRKWKNYSIFFRHTCRYICCIPINSLETSICKSNIKICQPFSFTFTITFDSTNFRLGIPKILHWFRFIIRWHI